MFSPVERMIIWFCPSGVTQAPRRERQSEVGCLGEGLLSDAVVVATEQDPSVSLAIYECMQRKGEREEREWEREIKRGREK